MLSDSLFSTRTSEAAALDPEDLQVQQLQETIHRLEGRVLNPQSLGPGFSLVDGNFFGEKDGFLQVLLPKMDGHFGMDLELFEKSAT